MWNEQHCTQLYMAHRELEQERETVSVPFKYNIMVLKSVRETIQALDKFDSCAVSISHVTPASFQLL